MPVELDRFPRAEDGELVYVRTFELPAPVSAEDFSNAVYVLHGAPTRSGDETAYDGDERSTLDAELTLEASLPVACAALSEETDG